MTAEPVLDAVSLFVGRTVHRREHPFKRAFSHAVALISIDIDRLQEAAAASRLFSVNRPNAIAFNETDHGPRSPATSLRLWAEGQLAASGMRLDGGRIELITFPRVIGHGFAPISIWLGHGPEGDLRGVIYEVHNTFGEAHAYVSAFNDAERRTLADKEFHVSPFFGVSGQYRFTLRQPGARLELIVENIGADGRTHIASLVARRRPMTDTANLGWLLRMPFSGLGVVVAIHWQALMLLIKGARYHDKPVQRDNRITMTKPHETDTAARPPASRPRKIA